jgi:hypothetical protein
MDYKNKYIIKIYQFDLKIILNLLFCYLYLHYNCKFFMLIILYEILKIN